MSPNSRHTCVERANSPHLSVLVRRVVPREPEAAFLVNPMLPRIALPKEWCTPAWPGGEPAWLKYSLSATAKQTAMQTWPDKLRVMLPDSAAAPSAARREAVWQRMAVSSGYEEELPLDVMLGEMEKLITQAGLVDRRQIGQPPSKPALFLAAALRAAAMDAGLERRTFRLFLMRTHQYLDVYSILSDVVQEPQARLKREHFERLLRERRHSLALSTKVSEWGSNALVEEHAANAVLAHAPGMSRTSLRDLSYQRTTFLRAWALLACQTWPSIRSPDGLCASSGCGRAAALLSRRSASSHI